MLPELEYEPTGDKKNGRRVYRVTTGGDWTWRSYTVKIPVGYETDLASIPTNIPFLDPDDERWAVPAILHDRACYMSRRGLLPADYSVADRMLYAAMIEGGSGKLWANVFYAFVRLRHKLRLG